MAKVSVVLSTYNEKENIRNTINAILKNVGPSTEIVVVDDDSPDGTWKIVEEMQKDNKNIKLLRRMNKRDLASAISDGIKLSNGDIIVLMDSDSTQPPSSIPELLGYLGDYDIAIGSRYVKGGKDLRSFDRVFTSLLFNLFASIFLGFSVRDYTTGFVAAKRNVVDKIGIIDRGYGEYCVDFLYQAKKRGFKIKEVPYVFSTRKFGETKTAPNIITLLRHGLSHGIKVLKLRFQD